MAEVTSNEAPTAPAGNTGNDFLKRELNGASFLSLEHAAHMVLVVVVSVLLVIGLNSALTVWMGAGSAYGSIDLANVMPSGLLQMYEVQAMLGIVAALVVLVPLLAVLDRRTRAEWNKRSGYATRLAYKMPIYLGLGVLTAGKLMAIISMLSVVITSLVLLGVSGVDIADLYLHQFLPAFTTAIVLAGAWWYMFKLAKGRDMGKNFSLAVALAGGALAIALLVTSAVVAHRPAEGRDLPADEKYFDYKDYDNGNLEDIFKY